MSNETAWRMGPLLRMGAGVLLCVFLGSLVALVMRFPSDALGRPELFALLVVGAGGSLLGALWMIATPWPEQQVKRRAFLFVLLMYAGVLFSAFAQKIAGPPPGFSAAIQLAITSLSFQGAVLVLVDRLLREHGLNWSEAFGFGKRWPHAVAVGAMVAVLVMPAAWAVQVTAVWSMDRLGLDPQLQHAVNVLSMTESWPDRLVLAGTALLLAPVAEELLFRGLVYPAFKSFGFPRLGFWITAVVFGLVHFNLPTFLPLVLFACVLNVLYDRTGNLLSCIAAHAVFNGVNLVILFVNNYLSSPTPLS